MEAVKKFTMNEMQEICIIDDSPLPRSVTRKVCETTWPAIPVRIFENVDTAIYYLTHASPKRRAIFVDLEMPGKDGWSFLETYPSRPSDKIFILSSSQNETDLSKVKDYPMVMDFLMKPLCAERINALASPMGVMYSSR